MRLEPVLQPTGHDVVSEAPMVDDTAGQQRRLRRLDFAAGVVAVGATAGFLVNALLLQAPQPGAPVADSRPAGAIQALEKKANRTTVPLPPAHPQTTSAPTGGATNGSLGYLSVRTTTAEAPVPLVPAIPGPGITRTEARSEAPRRPPSGLGAAPDVTGTLRPPGEVPGSGRILAVQKALAKLGYGPLKVDGMPGGETRSAVQRFQRDRNLSADGEISDRLVRELSAVSGIAMN